MGVPMRRTMVGIYALGGFYSALGGVIYALYTSSGYPLAGTGNELTAIASVVLGGTLLTGGVGMVAGTLFGGMILGLIATLINFNGSLNGAWIMISGGVLLVPVHRAAALARRFAAGSERGLRLQERHGAPASPTFAEHAGADSPSRRAGSAPRRGRARRRGVRAQHLQLSWPAGSGSEIVGGVYPPGSLLPNAADMCARFSVSRTALREAYSMLSAKALIVARPKIGTRVRPKSDWNLLDPEVLAWHLAGDAEASISSTTCSCCDRWSSRRPRRSRRRHASPDTLERIADAYGRMERFKNGAATSSAPISTFTWRSSRRRATIFSPRSAA